MNRLRQYITPFTATMLALVFVLVPTFAFAQSTGASYWIENLVWTILINISGMFLSFGGIVFDFAVNSFVIGFADYYTTSGVGFAVDRTWVVIRDFVNLFFIFGLVYIGFKMILDSNDSNTRRWLVNLIVAALLINFSLFITKLVVDFSNQISTQIAISGFGAERTGESATGIPNSAYEVDISETVLDLMGITSVLGIKGGGYTGYGWGYIFGTTIMFLVTAFVFFAGAFILIIRFAMLNLFMVLSPFMFIGWILPPLSNITSRYWDAFIRRAFFAPVYFLFLYFSLEILKAFRTTVPDLSEGQGAALFSKEDAVATISSAESTLPFFILICIFLIASIVIAQKIGADGAGTAIKYGQMARQKLQRGVTRGVGAGTAGIAARTGRNTVGRLAYAGTQNEKLKAYAAKSAIGKGLYKTAQYGAGATFDARNVGGVGKQLNLGQSEKGGFKKRIDDKVKAETKFAKDLGFVETDTPEGKRKVTAKEAEIRAEKEKERIEKEKVKKAAEDVKSLSNKMTVAKLDSEIEGLTNSVKAMEAKISYAEDEFKNKDTSVERKEELKVDIDNKKKALDDEKSKLNTHTEARAITVEKSIHAERLAAAQTAEATARTNNNYKGVQDAKAEQEKHQASLAAIDAKLDAEVVKVEDQLKEIDEILTADKKGEFKKLNGLATAAVKYERQIDYMNQVKRTQRMVSSIATLGISSGGAGLVGGAVVGSAAGLGGGALAGLSAAGAKSYELKEVISAIDKEYGKGGAKTIGKQKAKDRIKQEKEVEKELESDDEKEKKDDKKDDE